MKAGWFFAVDIDQVTQWYMPMKLRGRTIQTRNPYRTDEFHVIFNEDQKVDPDSYEGGDANPSYRLAMREYGLRCLDAIFGESNPDWSELKSAIEDAGDEDQLGTHEMLAVVRAFLQNWRMQAGDPDWQTNDAFSFVKKPPRTEPPPRVAKGAPPASASGGRPLPAGRTIGAPRTDDTTAKTPDPSLSGGDS